MSIDANYHHVGTMRVRVDMHCYEREGVAEWVRMNMDLEATNYADVILDNIENEAWQAFDGFAKATLDDNGNVCVDAENMTRDDLVKLAEHMSNQRMQLDEISGDRLNEWFEPEDFVDQDAYTEFGNSKRTVFIDIVLKMTVL